ncbi:MAG: sugar phosphate isomerase/epimerase [Candidatus Poribacteria bacterium]|nr:sugar phosphate isomerase/epimerase [Candidatus Poribacteria bacterium]MYK18032.1 TIM barrel protein [Candidatus Poribacteria bacterium]
MKLSCLPVSLYDDIFSGKSSVANWIQFGAELGLDAVDFSIKFFPERDAATLNHTITALEKFDVRPCMLACYSDFTHPDPTQRQQELVNLKADIELAKTLGAKFIRVTAGQNHPGVERTSGVEWVIDGFRRALDTAESHGITLAYENHTKGAPWDYWDFSQPTEIFLEILNALSDTPLGVCFDTANPLVLNEDVLALLDEVVARVVVLHIFDMREAGKFEAVRVGTGASPIPEVFSRMRRAGYDGWLSIEEASRLGKEGFTESIAFVREAWQRALSA